MGYNRNDRCRFGVGVLPVALVLILSHNTLASGSRRGARSVNLQRVAESGNLFAEDIYQVLTKPGQSFEDRNVVISPMSINVGLAMLRNGASGKTEEEISRGLRLKGMPEEEANRGYRDLIASVKETTQEDVEDAVQIQIANRIYVGQVYSIQKGFLEAIRNHFFADAEQLNFGEMNAAASTINNWIRETTRNRIKDIVVPTMLNNRTAMVLVNAMHFKGTWKYPFNPEYTTSKKRFKTITGEEIPVEMMQLDKPRRLKYAKLPELKASAVALPYTSQRYSLIVVLPDREEALPDLEDRLKDGMLTRIPTRLRNTSVDVRMPKLIMESNINLISTRALENLGMESISTDFAEFDRLSSEQGLRITDVIHKAFLEINEAGSEAAAASAFIAQARSLELEPGPTVKFVVDRPFIAYIYDSLTKSIIFVCRKLV